MEKVAYFGAVDYVVFVALFFVSIGIGVYFAVKSRKNENTEQYLMGDRKLSVIPVTLSMVVSFVSTNTLLGAPAEAYANGIMYAFALISALLGTIFVAAFFVPLLYPLKIVSVNEYLELRFQSSSVKYLGSLLFILNSILYVGTVIFGPATALTIATGAPPWIVILIVGGTGTLYTTIGGLKAVIWTDAFQSFIMVGGLIAVNALGASRVGGLSNVWKLYGDWNRLTINTSVDLTTRFTIMSLILGYTTYCIGSYGVNQPLTQRYCAMDSMKKGRLTVLLNAPGVIILNMLAIMTGIVAFAFYTDKGCDPIRSKIISNANQIVPYFVMEVLSYPGLPGIFLSSIFSASLSTLSSSLNSMAAVTWDDFLKFRLSYLPPQRQALVTKIMVVIYGLLCMAVSYLVLVVGGNLVQISTSFFGATIGPLLGLFILGALFPNANWKGALTGGILSIVFSLWIMFGQVYAKLGRAALPSATHNCFLEDNWNVTSAYMSTSSAYSTSSIYITEANSIVESPSGLKKLYSVSFAYFSLIGAILVVIIGFVVSLITGGNDNKSKMNSALLFPCIRFSEKEKYYESIPVIKNEHMEKSGYHLLDNDMREEIYPETTV